MGHKEFGGEFAKLERKVAFWEKMALIGMVANGLAILVLLAAIFRVGR